MSASRDRDAGETCEQCGQATGVAVKAPTAEADRLARLVRRVPKALALTAEIAWFPRAEWPSVFAYLVTHRNQADGWEIGWIHRVGDGTAAIPWKPLENGTAPMAVNEIPIQMLAQPIVDPEGRRVGWEALARAVDDDGHLQSYAWLREWAERHRSMFWLDRRCREEGLRQIGPLVGAGEFVSINFVPAVIYRPEDCLASTTAAMLLAGLEQRQVVLEVVESTEVREGDLRNIVEYYRDVQPGIRFALDDVGTGYNGLARLRFLRPDIVKLDGSIARATRSEAGARRLAQAVRALSDDMGAIPLAEGIEDAETWQRLKDLGYRWFQGYLWGRPGSVTEWQRTEKPASI